MRREWRERKIPCELEIDEAPFRDLADPLMRHLRAITADPDAVAERMIGAYQHGSNPLVDAAIRLREPVLRFLRQATSEHVSFDESREALRQLQQLRVAE